MGINAHYLQDKDKNKFYPYSHADASYDRNGAKVGTRLDEIDVSIKSLENNKIDKIDGKGLSTNDYTTIEKNKLNGIESNAQVNVQPDWNITDIGSDAYIKNKPTSLLADGGNSDTVNGHIVESDVPANAKFTDTVYVHPSGTNPHGTTKSDVGLGNVPNVLTNDQTPTFTEEVSLKKLTSGEKLSVAFGKISKAISDLISHISDNVKHITSTERTNWGKAYTHSTSAHAPSNAQANVIESVKVNDTALTPSSKAVNVTVPTKTSQLINDSGFKTTDTNTWRPLGTAADTACAGNDSRLSNARPASDVYSWAKSSKKPSYSLSEITGTLAIAKGGTGSTTAVGGRANLGAIGFVSSDTEPSGQNVGDLWFIEG